MDENKHNIFQKICLQNILRIFWPMKLTNKELYWKARTVLVYEQIRKRRWRRVGHILPNNISDNTSVKVFIVGFLIRYCWQLYSTICSCAQGTHSLHWVNQLIIYVLVLLIFILGYVPHDQNMVFCCLKINFWNNICLIYPCKKPHYMICASYIFGDWICYM